MLSERSRQIHAGPPTRTEIDSALAGAFRSGAIHRDQLVGYARSTGARPEVLELLARMPAYRYQTAGQLWNELPRLG